MYIVELTAFGGSTGRVSALRLQVREIEVELITISPKIFIFRQYDMYMNQKLLKNVHECEFRVSNLN